MATLRVLHVEDQERDTALLMRHLSGGGYDLVSSRVETAEAMTEALEDRQWDVILCDYSMPHFNALSALALLKEMEVDLPFIINRHGGRVWAEGTVNEGATLCFTLPDFKEIRHG